MPEPTPAAATKAKKAAAPKKAKPAAPAAPETPAPAPAEAKAKAKAKGRKAPKAQATPEPIAAAEPAPAAPPAYEAVAAKAGPIFGRIDEAALQVLGLLHEAPMTRGQVLDAYEGEAKVLDEMLADLTGPGFVAASGKKLAPTERGRALWALARQVAEA